MKNLKKGGLFYITGGCFLCDEFPVNSPEIKLVRHNNNFLFRITSASATKYVPPLGSWISRCLSAMGLAVVSGNEAGNLLTRNCATYHIMGSPTLIYSATFATFLHSRKETIQRPKFFQLLKTTPPCRTHHMSLSFWLFYLIWNVLSFSFWIH